uniref:Uncharacterized protein n=1 Tax=Romanomermis culicivorax TaxID=13658 RepID=A0A915L9N9_ROMCU
MYTGSGDGAPTVGGYGRGRIPQKSFSDSSSKPSPISNFAQTRPANPDTFYDSRNRGFFCSNDTSTFMCGRGKGRGREPNRFVSSPASGFYNNLNRDDNWSRNVSNSGVNKGRGKNRGDSFTSRNDIDTNVDYNSNAVPSKFAEKENWNTVDVNKDNLSGFGCGFACASDDDPKPQAKKGLPPITKNFYVEHTSITAITEDKIDEFR